jgi:peptidoglycan hydrolase-like protein with peptidoglycan-binding domain
VQRFIGGRAGTADGSFGARTRSAVIWYQRMRGLKADGVVGPATFRAMGVKNNL